MGVSDQSSKVALAGTAILGLVGLLWYFLSGKKSESDKGATSKSPDSTKEATGVERAVSPTVVLTQSSEDGKKVSLLHSSPETSPTHPKQARNSDSQPEPKASSSTNIKSENVQQLANALDSVFEKANNNGGTSSVHVNIDEVVQNSISHTQTSRETISKTENTKELSLKIKVEDSKITPNTSTLQEQNIREEIQCDEIKIQKAEKLQSKPRVVTEKIKSDSISTQYSASKHATKSDNVSTEQKVEKDNVNAVSEIPLTPELCVKEKATPNATAIATNSISVKVDDNDKKSLQSSPSSNDDSVNRGTSGEDRTRSQSGNGNVSDPCHSSDSGVSVQSEAEAQGGSASGHVVGASGDKTQQASATDAAQANETAPADGPNPNIYEFDFPSQLCGLLIGTKGKHIKAIMKSSGTAIALNPKMYDREHQKCTIRGPADRIQTAIRMIKDKFPPKRTGVDYSRSKPEHPMLSPEMMQLSLPQGVSVDAIVSSVVTANHCFLQQPTHPSFHLLQRQNQCMLMCYGQEGSVPELPRPIEAGVICAAPMYNGWYRAQVVQTFPERDECDIRFVDYGGYMQLPGTSVKQIRSDFTQLPFQAVECYLAHVIPPNDAAEFGVEASAVLETLVQGQILQAEVVGHESDGVPYVQLYLINGDKSVFVNRELVNKGVARWVEMGGV